MLLIVNAGTSARNVEAIKRLQKVMAKIGCERQNDKTHARRLRWRRLNFARQRGALRAYTKGSCPPYLWPLIEIKNLCRMRSVEVMRLTDAHAGDKGLYVARTKGNNEIVKWTPRLAVRA